LIPQGASPLNPTPLFYPNELTQTFSVPSIKENYKIKKPFLAACFMDVCKKKFSKSVN
jgi:hypothetical protein